MCSVYGVTRSAVLAREITKKFETIRKASLGDLCHWLATDDNQLKGEFVIIVQGQDARQPESSVSVESVLKVLLDELPVKQASKLAASITGVKKNLVYKMALEMRSI